MVSNVAEKSRLQKAYSDVPQIEIVTPEVPQAQTAPKIEIDEISSMHEVKAEHCVVRRLT